MQYINVHVPYFEVLLQVEIDKETTFNQLAAIIQKATQNDLELRIFRFKSKYYQNGEQQITLLDNNQKVSELIQPDVITAYAEMIGA
ncbi:hypothetical protein pb186bvf_019161 [Paramecium bursaria]